MTIIIDMTGGVTREACKGLAQTLTLRNLEHNDALRIKRGKPPFTDEQIVKLYGYNPRKEAL